MDQIAALVSAGESVGGHILVFPDSFDQVTGYPYIQSTILLVRHNVYRRIYFPPHQLILAQVQISDYMLYRSVIARR